LSEEEAIQMRSTKAIGIAILAALILAAGPWAWADDVYVDCRNTTGPWNGSFEHPYQTIQDAIDAATTYDGDTIRVADCIYQEGIVVDKFLEIIGSGPDVTTIQSTNHAIEIATNMEASIIGFRIVSPMDGILIKPDSNTVICNNVISARNGINADYACRSETTIKNNTIDQCIKDGLHLQGCVGQDMNAKVYDNIITRNGECGMFCNRTILTTFNNDVWGNGTNYCGCSPGPGCISENPRFVDPNTGNYRLQLASPCIDAGWPVKTELDPDGTRNNMGAYGGPGAATFWPDSPGAPVVTDLTVTPGAVPADGTVTVRARGRVRPFSLGQE
jgi:hypothetical protein